MATIGVFDSGVGGLSVANTLKKALPAHQIVYRDDSENIPYGTKTKAELQQLVVPIVQSMEDNCDVIVIACNTVSTTLMDDLRRILQVPLIAVEPMIQQAAPLSKSHIIAVCATPTTLNSQRYADLVQEYGTGLTILEPDCSTWAYLIENNQLDAQTVTEPITLACEQGADVIVLGCTHYHWIEELITRIASGRATVLQPESYIISQVQQVLARLD